MTNDKFFNFSHSAGSSQTRQAPSYKITNYKHQITNKSKVRNSKFKTHFEHFPPEACSEGASASGGHPPLAEIRLLAKNLKTVWDFGHFPPEADPPLAENL